MTFSELHTYCLAKGYYVEVLTGRSFIRISVFYGDAAKEMGAEDAYHILTSASSTAKTASGKPSINEAAKKCAMLLKVMETVKKPKWWERERNHTQRVHYPRTEPLPVRGYAGDTISSDDDEFERVKWEDFNQ